MNFRKVLFFSVGPVGGALLGFITVPIIAWYFSPEDIGRIAILNVAVSFGVLFFSFGLDQAYVREYHETSSTPFLLINTLGPGLIILSFFLLFFFFQPATISVWLFDIVSEQLGLMVLLCLLAAFISRFLSLILRMQEKGLAFSMSQVLPKVFFLVLLGFYIVLDVGFTTLKLVSAHTLSISLVCLVYGWNTRKEWMSAFKQKFDSNKIHEMLAYSVPLIFGGLAYWGLTAVDKLFLRNMSSFEELGIYSIANNFAAAATIFQSIFSTIWAPTVYKWASSGEGLGKVQQVTQYVLFIIVLIFCLTGLFSWLIDYILPDTYRSVKYIAVACLGTPLLYTLSEATMVGIGITKKTFYAFFSSFIALICNVIGNYFFIPRYGAAGAAISTCISFWVFFVCRTEFSILVWQRQPRLRLYLYSLTCVAMAVANTLFAADNIVLFLILWFCILVFSLINFRDLLKTR